jgi:lysozyme
MAAKKKKKRKWKREYAARFIAPWEGFLPQAYQDTGGIWTIGYGHTGPEVVPGLRWSRAKALRVLASDIAYFARGVDRLVKLTFRERIACISFAFNVGLGGFASSTFLKRLNENRRREAANALMLWVKDARGNTLLGLKRRRAAERWLMIHYVKGKERG